MSSPGLQCSDVPGVFLTLWRLLGKIVIGHDRDVSSGKNTSRENIAKQSIHGRNVNPMGYEPE